MSNPVSWPVLSLTGTPFVQGGEDTIFASQVSLDTAGGVITSIGLQTDPKVTGLKEIRVLSLAGKELAKVSLHDKAHGPTWIVLDPAWVDIQLEFVKAKFLNVPTGMYITRPPSLWVPDPSNPLPNIGVLFQWDKD